MKIPKRFQPLVEDGLIDEVISRLMSGKEADVFVVRSNNEIRCAKVYKDAMKRSFKKAAQYQEGRVLATVVVHEPLKRALNLVEPNKRRFGKTLKLMLCIV